MKDTFRPFLAFPFCNIDEENSETSGRGLTPSQMQSPLGMRGKRRAEPKHWSVSIAETSRYLWGQAQEGLNEKLSI